MGLVSLNKGGQSTSDEMLKRPTRSPSEKKLLNLSLLSDRDLDIYTRIYVYIYMYVYRLLWP